MDTVLKEYIQRAQLAIIPEKQPLFIGDSKIIHIAEDRQGLNRLDVWYETWAAKARLAPRPFLVLSVGSMIPDGFVHVQSVVMKNKKVWHVYSWA